MSDLRSADVSGASRAAGVSASELHDVRVASVPSAHVYVRHIAPVENESVRVVRLPDPHPFEAGRIADAQWWPPRMLEPDWVHENADSFDVFHLQFGFDAVEPERLHRLVAELRSAGKPLVYTAHDLRNPHHEHSPEHDAHLDILMAEADALITLTPGAAEQISTRWGRDATVIPHPHVVDFDTMASMHARRGPRHPDVPFRIGLHVKSLRANMNPLPLVRAIAETRHEFPNVVLQVDGHPQVLEPSGDRYNAELSELLKDYDRRGMIDLRIHPYFTDAELWDYLDSLDASILPYRFGTHSGWLEACRDLGTAAIAPTCGFYAEQGPVWQYRNDESGFDADSLLTAVATASQSGATEPLSVDARRTQRDEIAVRHGAVYESVLV